MGMQNFGGSSGSGDGPDADLDLGMSSTAVNPAASMLFAGAGNRLDGKAGGIVSPPMSTPRASDDESDDEPWNSRRIPFGVPVKPPYGFNEGHMTGKPAAGKTAVPLGGGTRNGPDRAPSVEREGRWSSKHCEFCSGC